MSFYKQYLKVKKENPDALVFYRVGDFYELFDTDAIKASEILSLTLTSRDCGLPERVPMCGIPYHSAEQYIAKLIEKGYKTAICESTPLKTLDRLKLSATGTEQTIIKEYLEANVSDVLATKINNGIPFNKDGKQLISKKNLNGFMEYACKEAQSLAEKGARSACIKSDTVFGWAIHYFEEDSIEGTLFNEDGTEYKPPKAAVSKNASKSTTTTYAPPTPKPKPQYSLFDLLDGKTDTTSEQAADNTGPEDNDIQDDTEPGETTNTDDKEITAVAPAEFKLTGDPFDEYPYEPEELTQISETQYVDNDGVIYEVEESKSNPLNVAIDTLAKLLENKFIVR